MVIANPKAGGGKMLSDWPVISNKLIGAGISYDVAFTTHRYHSIELTINSIRNGYVNIISIGGDGTMNEIVNGIFTQKYKDPCEITLAIIPGGSGNDLIKSFGITKDYDSSIKAIAEGKRSVQDIVRFHISESKVQKTRFMANIAGVGFDAMVSLYCNILKENGVRGDNVYLRGGARALFNHKAKQYKIIVDGATFFEGKVFSVAFGNGKYSGGGMIQTPNAVINDGLVDLTVIKKCSIFVILKEFKKLFSGDILSIKKYVISTRGRRIDIVSDVEDMVEVDGEIVGTTPLYLEVLPKSLSVIVGEDFR